MKLNFINTFYRDGGLTAGLIAGGAALLGSGGQMYAAGKMNRKTRKWNEKMYARQRADALADWNMQNQYNSPQAQMQRFKDAGLNPNLIYGNGTDANAGPVRSSDAPSWHPQAPDLSGIADAGKLAVSSYFDQQIKKQTVENLETTNSVMQAEKALKEAQAINLGASTSKSLFDLDMGKTLAATTIEAAKANLQKVLADTQATTIGSQATQQRMGLELQANERAAIKQGMDLKEAATRILKMRQEMAQTEVQKAQIQAQIDNIQTDTRLKKLSENLKSVGVESSDNYFLRMLGQLIGGSSGIKSLFNKLK